MEIHFNISFSKTYTIHYVYLPKFRFFFIFKLNLACQAQYLSHFELSNQVVHHVIERFKRYLTRNTSKKNNLLHN